MKKIYEKINFYIDKITNFIFSKKIIIILLMIPFFKTESFSAIPYLKEITNIVLVIECILFSFFSIMQKKTTPLYIMTLVYGIWTYLVCPFFNPTGTHPSYYYIVMFLAMISFLEIAMSTNSKNSLDAMSLLFLGMITLNLVLMIIFPEGIVKDSNDIIFLFGIRTGFPLIIFPGILLSMLYDNFYRNGKAPIRTIACTIIGTTSIMLQWVVTGIIQLLVLFALLLLFKIKFIRKYANIQILFVIIIVLSLCVTILGTDNSFFETIFGLFNKSSTISGRTEIWQSSINKIKTSPFFGVGEDAVVLIGEVKKSAHSHWLHIALESGVIGLGIILIAYFFSCRKLSKYKDKKEYAIVASFIVATLMACIVEIQTYVAFIFMIFGIPYLLKYLNKEEKQGGTLNETTI